MSYLLLDSLVSAPVQPAAATPVAHSFYDYAKDFILPFALGGLAAWMAYYVFYRGSVLEKAKAEGVRLQSVRDRLSYFTALLASIYKTASEQQVFLRDWVKKAKADDVNFHLMSYLPMQDLRRLVEMHPEPYLLAFVEFYGKDRKKAVQDFQSIIAICDFLEAMFESLKQQLKNGQDLWNWHRIPHGGFV
jgi:hypothetical protein